MDSQNKTYQYVILFQIQIIPHHYLLENSSAIRLGYTHTKLQKISKAVHWLSKSQLYHSCPGSFWSSESLPDNQHATIFHYPMDNVCSNYEHTLQNKIQIKFHKPQKPIFYNYP